MADDLTKERLEGIFEDVRKRELDINEINCEITDAWVTFFAEFDLKTKESKDAIKAAFAFWKKLKKDKHTTQTVEFERDKFVELLLTEEV